MPPHLLSPTLPLSPPTPGADIVALDATALSRAIHARALSCAEVLDAYLAQIDRLNPLVNALVALQDPEASRLPAGAVHIGQRVKARVVQHGGQGVVVFDPVSAEGRS